MRRRCVVDSTLRVCVSAQVWRSCARSLGATGPPSSGGRRRRESGIIEKREAGWLAGGQTD